MTPIEKKTVKHTLRMTEKESQKLQKWADRAGLPKAEYVRQKVFGKEPQPMPTPAFWNHLAELSAIHGQTHNITLRKDDGYIAWHGYQSFKPGEVTPELCHRVGVQTAKELWGDAFQIIVTTHLDKDHLHNHFCFNSVGFRDGRKYNYSKAERKRMMEVSDRICLEHPAHHDPL